MSSQNWPRDIKVSSGGGGWRGGEKLEVRERSDSYEFDLHYLYHNALESLMKYDLKITALRDQLASKDEVIAGLEGELVRISLELASAKAAQDESLMRCDLKITSLRDQLASKDEVIASMEGELVRISIDLASAKATQDEMRLGLRRGDPSADVGCKRGPRQNFEEEKDHEDSVPAPSTGAHRAPTGNTREGGRNLRPVISRSWTTRADSTNSRRGFLNLPGLRTSWNDDHSLLDDNRRGQNIDARESAFSAAGAVSTRGSSPPASKIDGIVGRSASETAPRRSSRNGHRRQYSWKGLIFTGMKKNEGNGSEGGPANLEEAKSTEHGINRMNEVSSFVEGSNRRSSE